MCWVLKVDQQAVKADVPKLILPPHLEKRCTCMWVDKVVTDIDLVAAEILVKSAVDLTVAAAVDLCQMAMAVLAVLHML
jgi:hypothetical protein